MQRADEYPLSALLRLRELEMQESLSDERNARAVVAERAEEARALEQSVSVMEERLRTGTAPDGTIFPDWQILVRAWLDQERESCSSKLTELRVAQRAHERATGALLLAAMRMRALERHRARWMKRQRLEQERLLQDVQDDLWRTRHCGIRTAAYRCYGT